MGPKDSTGSSADRVAPEKPFPLTARRAFKTGEITALDQDNDYQPIDWKKREAVYLEICELSKQPGKYQLKTGLTIALKGRQVIPVAKGRKCWQL